MQIAVVGNDNFVTGFRLAGITSVFESEKELDSEIEKALQNSDIGVIVMEEEAYNSLVGNRVKKRLEKLVRPVIVTISGKGKETNIGEMIKRSLGVDLWK
jgi:V/A-type H+-transporting ATPase subunit F